MKNTFFLYHKGLNILAIFLAALMISGCANHLADGWKHYEAGKYNQAQTEWEKEKEKPLTELVAKAKAAQKADKLYEKMVRAEGAGDYTLAIKSAMSLIALDQWEKRDWIEKSPNLKKYFTEAAATLEYATYRKMAGDQKKSQWALMSKEYTNYQTYCTQTIRYCEAVSPRIEKLGKLANRMKAKVALAQKKYHANFSCGRKNLLKEFYQKSVDCFQSAVNVGRDVPEAGINTDEAEYLLAAAKQSLQIQRALEEEKRKAAVAEKRRIEKENQKKAEKARRVEAALKAAEDQKIALAKKAEAARLRKVAAKRRAEEKRKRELEERNRRWRAYLKKGSPLKPLVTTLGVPSKGRGTLALKKKQKWQAGAQLPKVKNKHIKSKDVYALGISIPKSYKLTYLKNRHGKNRQNLLRPPRTQQGKRFYYTEDYKGGHYYTEVQNRKDKKGKYEIKSIIYKIPVTR